MDFPIAFFYIIIADASIRSLKSLHTSFEKYLDHMLVILNKNRMVRTMQNLELFDQKCLNIFGNVLVPFEKAFLWLKQLFDAKLLKIIFQCSKNSGNLTRVTSYKVSPNMADLISLNEKRPMP